VACDSWHQLSPSKLLLSNCILWDGKNGIWNNDNSKITINYSNIQHGWTGEGNIDADPLFLDADNGDYRLSADSTCIDAGTDAGVYDDIEGNIRPFDFPGVDNNGELPDFDMGAYEAIAAQGKLIIIPRTINRSTKGQRILALIHLPEPIVNNEVDAHEPLVLYPGAIEATNQYIFPSGARAQSNVRILALFDKADLLTTLPDNGNVELTAVGRFISDQCFYGTDTIKIIDRKNNDDN
jgi:hypothetical protein